MSSSFNRASGVLPLRFAAAVLAGLAAFGVDFADAAPAIPPVKIGIEKCVPTVLAKHPGEVLQVVLKIEDGQPVWEIEVEAEDKRLYDIECSGASGKIVETEERFMSADAPAFKAKAKLSEAEATKIVSARHPGTIEVVDYEMEADGTPVYEYDIELADGTDIRVEIDAVAGKLREAKAELIEIGRMPGAK